MGSGWVRSRWVWGALALAAPTAANAFESIRTGAGLPIRWKQAPITYAIDADGPRILSVGEADAIVHGAFDAWSDAAPSVAFAYEGTVPPPNTDFHPDHPELAHNVVHFVDHPLADGQLAFTLVRFSEATGEIQNAHIFVDEARHDFGPDGPAYDVESTLTHEVGHFLGLDHSKEAGSIMRPGLAPGQAVTVTDDDAAAVWTLYGRAGDPPPPSSARPADDAFQDISCQTGDARVLPWFALLLVTLRRRK